MFRHASLFAWLAVVGFIAVGTAQLQAQAPGPAGGYQVLARGPIHEAYAEPIVIGGETRYTINARPPDAINEVPPLERPRGDNVVWIPGYWSFDEDRNGFVWVSGIWRVIPPDRSWIPGYWQQAEGGYTWTPGFWQDASIQEMEYLPPPPKSLEQGPQGQPPSDNFVWVPGVWQWTGNDYAWRRGFWMEARADWDWTPAHYVCASQGCIYVSGYWDYPFDDRGMLFAPVYFTSNVYERPGFSYVPDIALAVGVLTEALFSFPRHYHYYFGDYYDARYERRGIYPWFEARRNYDWYDPIFVHRMWRHRDDKNWVTGLENNFKHRRDDKNARPADTYDALRSQLSKLPAKDRQSYDLARPLNEVVSAPDASNRFEKLNDQQRKQQADRAKAVTQYAQQRSKWEAGATPGATAAPPAAVPAPTPKAGTPATPRVAPAPRETPSPAAPKVTPPPPAPKETTPPKTAVPETTPPKEAAPKEATPPKTVAPETAPPKETTPPKAVAPETAPPKEAAPAETGKSHKVAVPTPPVSSKSEPGRGKEAAPPPKPSAPPAEAPKAEPPRGKEAAPAAKPATPAPPTSPDEKRK